MATYTFKNIDTGTLVEPIKFAYYLRYYEDQFRRYKDPKDEQEANKYRELLDEWFKDNLNKVPTPNS